MTEKEKMLTRQNLGLYGIAYHEADATKEWDGDTTGLSNVGDFYRISEDVAPEIKTITDADGNTLTVTDADIIQGDNCQLIRDENGNNLVVASLANGATINIAGNVLTFNKGIWAVDSVREIEYTKETTTVTLVPAEYLPLSTDIVTDKDSNAKIATPKAVYDYVGPIETILAQIIGADDTRSKKRGDFYEEPKEPAKEIDDEPNENNER